MATADQYAEWIVNNADKRGTPEFDTVAQAYQLAKQEESSTPLAPPPKPEKTGMLRAAADIPVQVGRGVAVGVKALSDVFGADNPVSRAASGVEDYLGGLLSAQAKNDQAEIARIMKEAQDKGVGDQVTAAVKAFATAPVDMLSQALGTAVPVIAGGLAGSVARLGAMGVGAIGTGVGAAMGAGTVKGQIYDAVKQELLQNKVPEAEAEKRAQEAQAYGGKNLDQILMGAGIGAAEAAFGAERILTGLLRKGAVSPSALPAKYRIPTVAATEAVPEMAQAAQEQVAQNIALQREGYDVPTMRGVVGQAALEGLAGAGLGAITGAVQPTEAAKPEAEAPKPAAPAEPVAAEAEAPKPVTGETGIVRPEEETAFTRQEQQELARRRLQRLQRPTAEDLLGKARGQIQTAPPTTPADIARIRDDHETAVINSLLEQDKQMQSVSDLARLNLERMSQTESMEAATQDADRRVREARLMGRVQSLIDQNIPFASTAIADINRKFELIGETPLDETERARVQNIMTMAQGFTDFVKLPSLPVREQDRFAENQAMEALIKERKPRGEVSPQPIRAEAPAPSPIVGEAPVSTRVEEGRAVRPEAGVEPGVAEDRQRAEQVEPVGEPVKPPVPVEEKRGAATRIIAGKEKIPAQWEVVEADSVKAAMTEGKTQPRDRQRAVSNAQIMSIAQDPDFDRLSDTSQTMDYGAPTLTQDGAIVGGNGRFEGVNLSYDTEAGQRYKQALVENAERLGLDPEQVGTMKKPILVRRITQPADTRKLAIQSNIVAGLELSDMEQAALDAERMAGLDMLEISETGDIPVTSRNMNVIRSAFKDYTTEEMGKMMSAEGGLSQAGLRRVRNAILYKAYGKTDTLSRLVESPDPDLKNVGTALMRASGDMSKMMDAIRSGAIPAEYDIIEDLTGAIETLSSLRASGTKVQEFLAQTDMFGDGISGPARAILRFMDNNLRSAKSITEFLNDYAQSLLSAESATGGLFGEVKLPTKQETVERAAQKYEAQRAAAKAQRTLEEQPASEVRPESRVQPEGEGRATVSDEEAGVKKSLRATPEQQVADFEQTLRTALNKFGLKDVGLKIIDGMTEAGSYAQKLIQIASDSANPIRDLRHEAIHALRELGFFTPQQWQSLSKMAKDKWIDQYLKQRNVDGKPLKAGEESRYDAYMREYEGDMEKITEEAVADAFADFDATKPPAGLMSALLTRLRNLFQAIKSALTKVESPEQIFGKVKRGELAAAQEARPAEEVRKSLRKEEPRPTLTTAGQSALDTINQLGMGVKEPEPGMLKKLGDGLKRLGENPTLTIKDSLAAFGEWMSKRESEVLSADAKFEADVRKGLDADTKDMKEILGVMLSISQSGAVHADAVATQAVLTGKAEFDPEIQKWVAVEAEHNMKVLAAQLDKIAEKYGLTKEEATRVAHTYFVAKNYNGIIERNAKLEAEAEALKAEGKTDEARDKRDAMVFVSDEQAAMVQPGLDLVKTIPELAQMVETWQGIRKNFVKTLVDSYLWSPEYATAMLDNIDYVPFYRERLTEEDEGPQMMIRGLQVKAKEMKLKGSEAAVNDVFDNMAMWMQYAMNRAIRNHKALQMIDVATDLKLGDKMMAEQVSEPKRGMNIVRVWRDGKQEFYNMADPYYLPAFQSLGAVAIPAIKFFTDISNILRRTVVMYPLFSAGQLTQDSVAAIFASGLKPKYALKIPFLAVQEFIKTYRGTSDVHQELTKFGAVGVRDFNAAVARQDAEILAGIKMPRGGKEKLNFLLERIAMSADNAVRQAVYRATMDAGLSKAEAVEKAFEIINFRRRGSSKLLNLMGQTVPFFYAYLSAQRVAYRTITGVGISPSERKAALETLAYTSAAVMALSFLYAMANGEDEAYEKTPDTVRNRSLMIPGTNGVRIPLRPDFFLFPKVIAEHTYHLLADNGLSDPGKFKKGMGEIFANAVLSPNVVPQIAKPTLEASINYSFFEGKPIVGFFEKNKEAGRQFSESTSEFAKFLGQYGASPQVVDHLVRGYFGSVGGLFLWGTNFMIDGMPGVPRQDITWQDAVKTLPGVGAFKQKSTENALKVDFYELRDEVEKAKNTFDDIKRRSPEGLQDFIDNEKNYAKLALEKRVTKITDELSKIRRAIQQIAAAPEDRFSAQEKGERIEELREIERTLLKAVDVRGMREKAMM